MKIKRAWRNFLDPFYLLFPVPILSGLVRHYTLTATVKNGELKVKKGLFNRDISILQIDNITDVQIYKTLPQRIIRVGTLNVGTSGTSSHEVRLDGVGSPMKVREKIMNM